jgi:hypothetical protein
LKSILGDYFGPGSKLIRARRLTANDRVTDLYNPDDNSDDGDDGKDDSNRIAATNRNIPINGRMLVNSILKYYKKRC